jgi:hypothetical protein
LSKDFAKDWQYKPEHYKPLNQRNFLGKNHSSTLIPFMMEAHFYTHALWHVKEGQTEAFIEAWKRFGTALSQVPNSPPVQGTLIQSLSDTLIFYSFGPWEALEDIHAMRRDNGVKNALAAIMELCQEAKPSSYKTVLHLSLPGRR